MDNTKQFNFTEYKENLHNRLLDKNKKQLVFSQMIENFKELYNKNKQNIEKNDNLQREIFMLKTVSAYLIVNKEIL